MPPNDRGSPRKTTVLGCIAVIELPDGTKKTLMVPK
jgi:hypothetical protein